MIKRIGFLLAVLAGPVNALDAGYSGAWYNSAQSGHGIFLEVTSPTRAIFTWYVYDNQGRQVWLLADGTITGNRIDAQAFITRGMRFGSFRTTDNTVEPWGTVRVEFQGCGRETMSWTSNYSLDGSSFPSGSVPIERLTSISGVTCGKRAGSGIYQGFVFDVASQQYVDVVGLLDENGNVTFLRPDGVVLYFGTYTTSGSQITLSGTALSGIGYTFPGGSTVAAFSVQGSFVDGDFVTATGSNGNRVSLAYDGRYNRGGGLGRLSGSYRLDVPTGGSISLSVNAAGEVNGTDTTGCRYQGTMGTVNDQFNSYTLTLVVSGCSVGAGSYSGVATLVDFNEFGDNRALIVGVRSTSIAFIQTFRRL